MRNLAGPSEHTRATEHCRDELIRCGIEVVELDEEPDCEVKSKVEGRLGPFKFRRAWYYWAVNGPTPLKVAEELYENVVGKRDVRVAGHCGCPPPEHPWVKWVNPKTGREIIKESSRDELLSIKHVHDIDKTDEEYLQESCDRMNWEFGDPQTGEPFINSYHIDSELGLYIFVETLKKHGVV